MIYGEVVVGIDEFSDGFEKLFRHRVGSNEFAEAAAKKIVEAIEKGCKVHIN